MALGSMFFYKAYIDYQETFANNWYQSKHKHAKEWSEPYQYSTKTKTIRIFYHLMACGLGIMMYAGGYIILFHKQEDEDSQYFLNENETLQTPTYSITDCWV